MPATIFATVRNMKFIRNSGGSIKNGRIMGLFMMVHGLVHLAVALAPNTDGSPGLWMLNPSTSVFTTLGLGADIVIGIGITVVGLAAVGFMLSGISVLTRRWAVMRNRMIVSSSLFSLCLLFGFFNIYWMAAIGIDLALIALFVSEVMPSSAVKTTFVE
ncbi:MAG TPA: hypothetical protein VGK23_12395 [Methanomassiliicoccales archaeon]|jgi:hypothetical protein